jgi:hypothetical protein
MKTLAKLAILIAPLAIAGCLKFPHAGSFAASGTVYGADLRVDPVQGEVGATLGYKSGVAAYAPNKTDPEGDGGTRLTGTCGQNTDGLSVWSRKAGGIDVGDKGGRIDFGDELALGMAANLAARGAGNAAVVAAGGEAVIGC